MNRPTIDDAIELAWFGDESAVQIAQRCGVTKWKVYDVWAKARAAGRILKMRRDQRPAEFERLFRELFETRTLAFLSIPPITPATKADRLKEVA